MSHLFVAVSWIAFSPLFAGTMPPPTSRPQAATDDGAVLSGPRVSGAASRTLVQFDFSGRLVMLEARPEEAGVELLKLPATQREAVRKAIESYRTALSMHLVDNIDLVKQSTDAIRAGETEKAQQLGRELYDRFDPHHSRDPLMPFLNAVLEPEQRAELKRLVDEYWKARIDAELRDATDRSEPARRNAQQRLVYGVFQLELRSAYERTLRPYHDMLETIYQAVEPTAEQRAAIREIVIEHIRRSRLNPTPEQRQHVATELYQALDEPARIKLFELLLTRL